MIVSANQENLSKALSIVSRAVSSRTAMPVLSNILLEAKGGQLRLAATNREIDIHEGEYFVRFYQPDGGYYATVTAASYEEAKRMAHDGAQSVTDLVRKEGE